MNDAIQQRRWIKRIEPSSDSTPQGASAKAVRQSWGRETGRQRINSAGQTWIGFLSPQRLAVNDRRHLHPRYGAEPDALFERMVIDAAAKADAQGFVI